MGRVYGMAADPAAGVRSGLGYRFFTHAGAKLAFVTRVAFDGDADEGTATVVAYAHAGREVLIDPVANAACQVSYRTWVRAVPPGQPDPGPTPDAVLWRNPDGTIQRLDRDPLPDVPETP